MDDRDIGRSPEPPDEPEYTEGYEITKDKLWTAIGDTIALYQENINQFGMSQQEAKRSAIIETMDGIDYDCPSFAR